MQHDVIADVIAAGSAGGGNSALDRFTLFGSLYFASGATLHVVRVCVHVIRRRWPAMRDEIATIDREFQVRHHPDRIGVTDLDDPAE